MQQSDPTLIPAKVRRKITWKEARYAAARINGCDMGKAARLAGFSEGVALHAGAIIEPKVAEAIDEAQEVLATHALAVGLVDAAEVLEHLTDEIRGDLADLYDEAGELKPIHEWPLWARQGGVEVLDEPNMVHSADGGGGSWDQVGRRLKIRAGSRQKTIENAMKHKAVDAMVQPGDKLAGAVGDLASSLDRAIAEGRQRASQRNKLPINVTPSSE